MLLITPTSASSYHLFFLGSSPFPILEEFPFLKKDILDHGVEEPRGRKRVYAMQN